MSAKKEKPKTTKKESSNPLIKTLAEVQAMSEKEKQDFRTSNGTTINNPK